MYESKYSSFLTVVLVVIIIGVLGILGFLGFSYYKKVTVDKEASEAVDSFIEEVSRKQEDIEGNVENLVDVKEAKIESNGTKKLNGYEIVGTIEIPKTKVKYPILEKVTKGSIEIAVAVLYGPGPNEVGDTFIVGHNYRNGQFFSNNKKLTNGDSIYITDRSGNRVAYSIYNKFETTEDDSSFLGKDTNGGREITLSTCTDDSKKRTIIFARADDDK